MAFATWLYSLLVSAADRIEPRGTVPPACEIDSMFDFR
jgi:hypothetical protein